MQKFKRYLPPIPKISSRFDRLRWFVGFLTVLIDIEGMGSTPGCKPTLARQVLDRKKTLAQKICRGSVAWRSGKYLFGWMRVCILRLGEEWEVCGPSS